MFTQLSLTTLTHLLAQACAWLGAGVVRLALVVLVATALVQPGLANSATPEPEPSAAVPQVPQPVFGQKNAAQQQPVSQLPQIELGPQVKRLKLDATSEYWVDDTGQASVMEVEARQAAGGKLFAPRTATQSHSLQGKALWIRFEANITDSRARWFLDVMHASTDEVTLYWRDNTNQWVKLRSGDAVSRKQWPVLDRYPLFQLNHERLAPTMYYLRVAHSRAPFSAPLHIYRDTELVAQRQIEHLFLGSYFGLVTLICLVCGAMALALRDSSFVNYAMYVLAVGLSQASFTGVAAMYLWPDSARWSGLSTPFLASIAAAMGLWFVRTVIKPLVHIQRLDLIIVALITAEVSVAFIDLIFPSQIGFWLSNSIMLAITLVVYFVVWSGWTRGDGAMPLLALGFLPVVLGVMPPLMHNAGLMTTNFFTQYGVCIGSALEMPLLLYGLVLRSATRREGRARAAGLPTKDALTGLSNTRDLLRQIHGSMTRAARYKQQYGLVLVELTNYAWFVKEHGREVSDRALVLLGTRLQLIARDVDTTARIDDNHFILLIEGPCKPSHAAKVAAQIAACAYRPTDLLPVGASLKLQVTCALMPDLEALELGDDANAQLGWLVHSSEALDSEPRKSIRTLNF
jgi:two-component system, sensor histidine kinase LadS